MIRSPGYQILTYTFVQFVVSFQNLHSMFSNINFVEIFSSFIVMAAIIDIFGSIPIFVSMRDQNKTIKAGQACLTALGLIVGFVVGFAAGLAAGCFVAGFFAAGPFV